MSKSEAKKIAKKYANTLKKKHIQFVNLYLFGSAANNKANCTSDIDLALVVNTIKSKKDYLNQKKQLWEIAFQVDSRIEPILLEEKDFEKDTSIMADQVKTYGILIQ